MRPTSTSPNPKILGCCVKYEYKQNANLINHLIFYSREDCDFWIMLLLWIIEPWPAVVGGAANCVRRQSFVEVFPEPTQWFPWQSGHCFQCSTVWRSEHRGYQILFLTHRDFSAFSDSSDDVMNCRWWDILSKLFAILHWGTSFWFFIFLQIGEPLPIFYFWETLPL